jgi:hypothetical protein
VVDHVPLDRDVATPSLSLLVGRVTTIKLSYWLALTVFALAHPALDPRPFAERFPLDLSAALILTVGAVLWARASARARDRRAGTLRRSVPAVATAFVASAVIASPASIPLLVLERGRSLEGCAPGVACHVEALVLWAALFAAGTFAVPLAFALSLPPGQAGQ